MTALPQSPATLPAGRRAGARAARYVAADVDGDLAYTVAIERALVRLPDRGGDAPVLLRVTHVFRRERGEWTLVDRRTEPVVAVAPAGSLLEELGARVPPDGDSRCKPRTLVPAQG